MKKIGLALSLCFLMTTTAFAGHGVERGLIKINDSGKLETVIRDFLAKKLNLCAVKPASEVFTVLAVKTTEERVDNGITDIRYEIVISSKSDVLTVQILDADFDNYRDYEEKLSSEISYDRNGFCKN